jgi:anthranilate synthase component 1
VWRVSDGRARLTRRGPDGRESPISEEPLPIEALRALLARSHIALPDGLPPPAAGWFGYLGYDMVRHVEHLPAPPPDHLHVPDAVLFRPTLVAVLDSVGQRTTLVSPIWPEDADDVAAARTRAVRAIEDARERLGAPLAGIPARVEALSPAPPPQRTSNTARERFMDMVERVKAYCRSGDVFQTVLSQRFSIPFALPSFALYRSLRRLNPSPFLFHIALDDLRLVGSSPEILVRVRDGEVTVRPIAGTRPRGATEEADREYERELLADPKERAEHLMLLDLGRNDVGRVASARGGNAGGGVTVTESFVVERYSHVMHIVSNVTGRLRPGLDALDALLAGMPAGTVSGAPKVRALQVIDELEVSRRGIYAGAVGYFSANGDMDTCIVLRTGLIKDGMLHVQAGAGIVLDSDPASEFDECVHKSNALFAAAAVAPHFVDGP